MKPRIGVTSSPSLHEDRFLEALDRAYVSAVIRAGALPFVLPVLDPGEVEGVITCLDGILFTGGGDIEPVHYAPTASAEASGLDPERDTYELALARTAVQRGVPVLGICRGCQVINVALGGTLVQHLPEVTDMEHRVKDQWAEAVHTVRVLAGSLLSSIVGREVFGVNSLHHQAVDVPGSTLTVSAWAEDGTAEAVEGAGRRVLGVQWHPELLVAETAHMALFDWLIEEAGRPRPAVDEPTAADEPAADEPAAASLDQAAA
jgi:putative glutamine amidotransferase